MNRHQPFAREMFFRYNENHDPDTGQFASGDGGGGSGGSVEPSAAAPAEKPASSKSSSGSKKDSSTGYEFVSPSVADHLDFGEAVDAIDGDQQKALREASLYINGALGTTAKEHDIVGAWADGAENSVMDIVEGASWDKLVLSGAMKGYLADQKQVLIFHEEDNGKAALSRFEATGKLADIHRDLLKDGLAFHTLVPHEGGATVYVADLDGSAFDAVERGAERYDSEVEVTRGRAEFLGTQKQDGSDRQQRDDARSIYQGHIDQSTVQGGKEIWDRVRDRWSEAHQISSNKTERSSRALRNERPLSFRTLAEARAFDLYFSRYNENHDPDTGEFTSGDGGGSGGSVDPTPGASTAPSKSTPVAAKSTPAATTVDKPASEKSSSGSKTKAKITDFEKDKVNLGRFKDDKAKADKFVEEWESRVGETPAEFKQQFLGGVDATMHIEVMSGGDWEIQGKILGDGGHTLGTYTRRIDWRDKSAESAYLQLNRSSTNKAIGKKILAGNVEMYQKLGLDKVKVHANIDVGGYAWAKYGYVPDRNSWRELQSDLQSKIGGESSGGGSGYRPESWDEISEHEQDSIRDAWMRSTRDDFIQSEIDNWRDNGDALDDAKYQLADNFTGDEDWAVEAVNDYLDEHKDDDRPVPYTAEQILAALSAEEYQTGYSGDKDPEFTFDDDKLKEPSNAPPKEQMTLPGIEMPDLSSHLTDAMREDIVDKLTKAFNDQAQKDAENADPPEHIYENVAEYQADSWDSMSDRDKYRWADQNGHIEEQEIEDDDQSSLDIDGDEADTLRELVDSSDPKALWAIADSEKGKELLLGTDWYGTLNLKDKETMDRFSAYVGKSKGEKNAIAA